MGAININIQVQKYRLGKGYMTIYTGLCKGCGLCMVKCPGGCLSWSDELGFFGTPAVKVDDKKCTLCSACEQVCPDCAIAVEFVPKPRRRHRLKAF